MNFRPRLIQTREAGEWFLRFSSITLTMLSNILACLDWAIQTRKPLGIFCYAFCMTTRISMLHVYHEFPCTPHTKYLQWVQGSHEDFCTLQKSSLLFHIQNNETCSWTWMRPRERQGYITAWIISRMWDFNLATPCCYKIANHDLLPLTER